MTQSHLRPASARWLSLACCLVTSPLAAQSVEHPLDPLSFREYAAGDYPTLSTPGQGLPAWTKANRRIEQVMWHSFELRPFDFFDRNQALDLPRR